MLGAGSLPLASVTVMPPARTFWSDTAFAYRAVVDFLRYLHPDYADADVLRERIRRKVLPADERTCYSEGYARGGPNGYTQCARHLATMPAPPSRPRRPHPVWTDPAADTAPP